MKKRIYLLIFLLLLVLPALAYIKDPNEYTISPEKNAYFHNNLGVGYANEGIYDVAIQEFKIAIALAPNTQAGAVYSNNLGELYLKINSPKDARFYLERAVELDKLNFSYYKNLAKCYNMLGIANFKIKEYNQKSYKSSLSMIMVGLLYEQIGDRRKAIIKLDEFVMSEPDLIITQGVKYHIKMLTGNY